MRNVVFYVALLVVFSGCKMAPKVTAAPTSNTSSAASTDNTSTTGSEDAGTLDGGKTGGSTSVTSGNPPAAPPPLKMYQGASGN